MSIFCDEGNLTGRRCSAKIVNRWWWPSAAALGGGSGRRLVNGGSVSSNGRVRVRETTTKTVIVTLSHRCPRTGFCLAQHNCRSHGIVNVTDICSKFTIDTIGRCAFGLNCNALFDSDSEFQRAGQELFKPTIRATVLNIIRLLDLGRILDWFRIRSLPDFVYEFYFNLFKDTLELRGTEKIHRNDFVSILIKLRNEEKANDNQVELFTDEVLASNAFIFFVAGFETTASTMSYCLYELALNQDIQVELREQIKQILNENDGKLTYDIVKDNMKYLDMVLNETLRMHPPGSALLRVCTKKFKIPESDITLDIGMRVLIPTYALHFDPKYYPQPEIFDPLRFTEENKTLRPDGTFLPFGDGPRICIGMKFAMMEVKIGLAEILLKFEILPCKDTQIPIKINPRSILLTPDVPISLLFKKIE